MNYKVGGAVCFTDFYFVCFSFCNPNWSQTLQQSSCLSFLSPGITGVNQLGCLLACLQQYQSHYIAQLALTQILLCLISYILEL